MSKIYIQKVISKRCIYKKYVEKMYLQILNIVIGVLENENTTFT